MKHTTMITAALLALTGWAHLAAGEENIEVTVTPEKPAVLPDGSTKVAVKKESVYLQVKIGDETITLESFDFDYPTKSMKIRVQTVPKATEAKATIVQYGDAPE